MESSSSSPRTTEGSTKIILKLPQTPQPLKDHEKDSNQCTQVELRFQKPEWVDKFLRRTFFDACSEHPIRRNELNKYCIDCDASLCQYCLSLESHVDHRILKIYRHVYKDVVPVDEIVRHMDYSLIQPYRCNKQMVLALTPLPHTGGKAVDDNSVCLTCKRKLIEYDHYHYCSISCKVEAFKVEENDPAPPSLVIEQPEEGEVKDPNSEEGEALEPKSETGEAQDPKPENSEVKDPNRSKRKRKRKGIPHRAPFF